ncbi:MAG: DNA gyrase subunit A [Leptolyngbya sp. PLA3]|nr:MAG: DNA gyrase subunit A [Cyanobacteria bacterium CYA]MCE7967146.1 DNA gyrase subunit A [Leptolyngbya sp. PL-A3]
MSERELTEDQAAGGPPGDIPDGPTPSEGDEGGRIVDLDIERELQDSYLTYAMSTIMDRALPDVRDGLKPSQRRILVAMNDLGLRPGKKHYKCAKITGDTSGNYHPHGNQVVYPTLVGMAQKWKMRVPLIDPQGNFGSIDGDPPAAERYTEARMTHAAMDMLADLKLDTVDFQPNYDDRLTEPTVLPGRFPNLLINGGIGIAVGMATSLPPHNPAEILDAITRVVDRPDISLLELMSDETDEQGAVVRQGVKGPDFPTGGAILGKRGILEAYETGRGRVTMRGVCHIEELANGREQIVVDQIPYGMVQDSLVEEIVNAVKEERLKDISDVRNESGRNAQTRIVLELKRGADARVVENQLFQHTQLQQTFSIINVALVNRQPRTLGLKQLIECYISHRVDVIRRRTAHLLREAKKKAHVLEGMIYAVVDIDQIIALIKSSQAREEAIGKLMARRYRIPPDHPASGMLPARLLEVVRRAEPLGGVRLSRVQAETIGSMRLIQLVGLEIERLVGEYSELSAEIENYESILADPARIRRMIKDDCAEMKQRYHAPRLTAIEEAAGDISIESLIQVEDMAVTISHSGYAKRLPVSTYQAQGRGGKGIRASDSKDDDFVEHLFVASTHDDLLCFTDTGRVFKIKVYELPELARTSRGRPIVNFIDLREGERTCAYLAIKNFEAGSHYLTFVSRGGIVKRTPLKAYANVNRSGLIAVGLKEGDALLNVMLTTGSDDVILVTALGMAIRFNEDDARDMGRSAAGVKGIELEQDDVVIGAVRVPMWSDDDGDSMTSPEAIERNRCLLTITEGGYGKRTPVDDYRVQPEIGKPRSQSRGGKGRVDIRVTEKNGRAVAALSVESGDDVVVITRNGQLVRTRADTIRETGRAAQGVRVVSIREGDSVVAAARVFENEEDAKDAPVDEDAAS